MMPNVKEILKGYPYLLPLLIPLLLWLALVWLWSCWVGILRAANCEHCPEDKWLCIVACDEVSRRLDLVDQALNNKVAQEALPYHPCRGCPSYHYGCDGTCSVLSRWELMQ
jgi:hypothetical protein